MGALFDDLRQGLQEAIDYEKGKGSAKVTTYKIEPVKRLSNHEIKGIRKKVGMTQKTFDDCMGVSCKTVEAWERGTTHPTGPACRLLGILSSGDFSAMKFIMF
ncbi:MAG: helix-turn-helix domain-containing protein [Schwartzia sp.]|nr:helix-turn-helix domain-containing protein [Schwartzia sp. (in: firmicutes)]